MLILGVILLIAGFLLCLTIVWAAIGFLAMGLGLICLLIAERRHQRVKLGTAQLPQTLAARSEIAQATPQEEVAPHALFPELPKAEPHPPRVAVPAAPIVSQRSGIEIDRRAARQTVAAARRAYDVQGRRLIARDDADFPRSANINEPATRLADTRHADLLATAIDGTPPAAATSSDPGRDTHDAAPNVADPGERLGRAVRDDATTLQDAEPAKRQTAIDAEDADNLAELLSRIARPVPGAQRG